MPGIWVPIDPLQTPTGGFAVLANDPSGPVAPVPLSVAGPDALANFVVRQEVISLSVGAHLNVGAIFTSSGSVNDRAMYFDATAHRDEVVAAPSPTALVTGTRWGVGLRILLRVTDVQANASFTFGAVGAAVELGYARAQYEILGMGLGINGLLTVLTGLPAIGDFKSETFMKLNDTIVPALARQIDQNRATLVPQPIAVQLTRPINRLGEARSVYYAMRRIADQDPLSEALKEAPGTLSRDLIREVYAELAGAISPAAEPSNAAEDRAERWLNI